MDVVRSTWLMIKRPCSQIRSVDAKGASFCIRMLDDFLLGNHLCITFECEEMNLRQVRCCWIDRQSVVGIVLFTCVLLFTIGWYFSILGYQKVW